MNEQETILLKNWLATASREQREEKLSQLSKKQLEDVQYNWAIWRREKQKLPSELFDKNSIKDTLLVMAARGFGKSRMASESIRQVMCGSTPLGAGMFSEILLVGETDTDLKAAMIDGPSGILRVHPEDYRPTYNASDKKFTWPNGAVCHVRHDRSYENIPGLNVQACFSDELAKWRYMEKTVGHIDFANRISHNGSKPIHVITTTPRPKPMLKKLMEAPSTILVAGTTEENIQNLAPNFIAKMKEKYAGTKTGRQELYGEFLSMNNDALWTYDMIPGVKYPDLNNGRYRVVIAVDPSTKKTGDECGIVIAAKDMEEPNHYYVLEDASFKASPAEWAAKVVQKYERWSCSKVIVETNQGGDMVEEILRGVDNTLPIKKIHAFKGKMLRAEPISMLYEQKKVFHCNFNSRGEHIDDHLEKLESEMVSYSAESGQASPNRLDALVYALTELKGRGVNSSLIEKAYGMSISGFYD